MNDRSPRLNPGVLAETLNAAALREDALPIERKALFQAAEDARKKAAREAQPILVLPPLATPSEVKSARRLCAVRRDNEVFLPMWQNLRTSMPNLLLRSSLWSARTMRHSPPENDSLSSSVEGANATTKASPISSLDNAVLINRGPALGSYDRRVFAGCLDYYRGDRPLTCEADEASYIEVSYFKFIASLGSAYSADGRKALRASLERLSAMSLHVRHLGVELQLPRILEVSFADAESRHEEKLKSSDLFYFRVREDFAKLYGRAKWTAVPHDALNAGAGLKSWLACFYATHSKPFPLELATLQKLAGSEVPMWKFRSQLKTALNEMKSAESPPDVRVDEFELGDRTVTVRMASWALKMAETAK